MHVTAAVILRHANARIYVHRRRPAAPAPPSEQPHEAYRMDTGFPRIDAEHDFLRARRRNLLAQLSAWLRMAPEANRLLSFDRIAVPAPAGNGSPWRTGVGTRSRPSRPTGSASATSSSTATTAYRSPARGG